MKKVLVNVKTFFIVHHNFKSGEAFISRNSPSLSKSLFFLASRFYDKRKQCFSSNHWNKSLSLRLLKFMCYLNEAIDENIQKLKIFLRLVDTEKSKNNNIAGSTNHNSEKNIRQNYPYDYELFIPPEYPERNHFLTLLKKNGFDFEICDKLDVNYIQPWPKYVPLPPPKPPSLRLHNSSIRVTYIGHLTTLIQSTGINIIINPHFSTRCGPFGRIGIRRVSQPGIDLLDLPPIDLILITNNEFDALDLPSVKNIFCMNGCPIITGKGMTRYFHKKNFTCIYTLNEFEEVKYDNVRIIFTPSTRPSHRYLFDRNIALPGGFLILFPECNDPKSQNHKNRKRKCVYYSGKTSFNINDTLSIKKFIDRNHKVEDHEDRDGQVNSSDKTQNIIKTDEEINNSKVNDFPIDLSIFPIGNYKPQFYMNYFNLNPLQAIKQHQELKSRVSLGIATDTFQTGVTNFGDAKNEFKLLRNSKGIRSEEFEVLSIGESRVIL